MGNPVTVSVIKNIQQYLTHSAKADSIIANEKTYSEVIRDMVRKQTISFPAANRFYY